MNKKTESKEIIKVSSSFSLSLCLCVKKKLEVVIKRHFLIIGFVFFLTSCNLAPKYCPPRIDIPDSYRLELQNATPPEFVCKTANIKWWEQFHDKVLDDLIITALGNNYDIKIAIARVDQYRAILGIVSSNLFPQVGGELNKTRQQLSLETFPPLSPQYRRFNVYSATISAAYELDIWGKIKNRSDAAYYDYLAQIEVKRTVILTLVSAVADSYVNLRKLDKQLEISKNTLKTRIESERIARLRFESGFTSELEYKQAQSETETAIIAIKRLEITIPVQENLISVLVGMAPTSITRGKILDALVMPPNIPVGLPSDLLWQRPDIQRAEDAIIASNYKIGEARAEFFPDITLTGMYGNQSSQLHNLFTGNAVTWATSANLFQPIFTGGRLLSQLELAKSVKSETVYIYCQTILNALKEVNDALISHKMNLELVIEQTKQVKIFERYRYLAELQYNNGQSDYLNVLDAERRLFESQLLLADTEANSFSSLINLYKALGGGWVIEAEHINEMLLKCTM